MLTSEEHAMYMLSVWEREIGRLRRVLDGETRTSAVESPRQREQTLNDYLNVARRQLIGAIAQANKPPQVG